MLEYKRWGLEVCDGLCGLWLSWWMDGVVEGWQVRYGVLRDCARGLVEREDVIWDGSLWGRWEDIWGGTCVVVGSCSALEKWEVGEVS